MSLVGLDLNTTRVRAVSSPRDGQPVPLRLGGDAFDLPLALSLKERTLAAGRAGVPFDPASPMVTSGIRLGSPAATTRGFDAPEFKAIGAWIAKVVDGLSRNEQGDAATDRNLASE